MGAALMPGNITAAEGPLGKKKKKNALTFLAANIGHYYYSYFHLFNVSPL